MNKISDCLRHIADKIDEIGEKGRQATRHKKDVTDSTVIINALKKIGIPFTVGALLCTQHSPQYIARKIFLYEYKQVFGQISARNPIAFIRSAIKEDYQESDQFLKWLKEKKWNIRTDDPIEYRRLLELI